MKRESQEILINERKLNLIQITYTENLSIIWR